MKVTALKNFKANKKHFYSGNVLSNEDASAINIQELQEKKLIEVNYECDQEPVSEEQEPSSEELAEESSPEESPAPSKSKKRK